MIVSEFRFPTLFLSHPVNETEGCRLLPRDVFPWVGASHLGWQGAQRPFLEYHGIRYVESRVFRTQPVPHEALSVTSAVSRPKSR